MKKKIKRSNVLVGICAGIASYKTCELVRLLVKGGFSVKVIMTDSAAKFVSPLVFQELSKGPVYTEMFDLIKTENIKHIALSQWADVCLIAPATANTISKIANGICDNLFTTVICALNSNAKVIIAAAMNENMWKNPLIQENVRKLRKYKKYLIMTPEKGELACGSYGQGRMPQIETIYSQVKLALLHNSTSA